MLPNSTAPCRKSFLNHNQLFSRLRTNSSVNIPRYQARHLYELDQKLPVFREKVFMTIGKPQVHVLRGFAAYKPQDDVIEAIRKKANQSSVVAFPRVDSNPLNSGDSFRKMPSASFSSKSVSVNRPLQVPAAQEAFFVVDLDRVREKNNLWNRCFPTVKAHYAVKANPNPVILRLMAKELNLNFDCASQSEIEAVLKEGVDPSRIIFANPCKSLAHIEYARRVGVLRTTFDSESELYKIKGVHPDAQVILRIWVDDKEAQCPLSNKYGAHLHEAIQLLEVAKQLELECVGVSFHVGSGASPKAFTAALDDARKVFSYGLQMGFNMRVLDIGGGFPGTDQDLIALPEISKLVNPILERDFRKAEIIAEPGRFFCSESQTLATQIIGKRLRAGGSRGRGEVSDSRREYYINDGLYQSFNCILYDHSVLLKEPTHDYDEERLEQGAVAVPVKYPSLIFGQTCDGLDTICNDILLPDLRVGDWLAVPNMGAYTNGASSGFNGFPLNTCVVIDRQSNELC